MQRQPAPVLVSHNWQLLCIPDELGLMLVELVVGVVGVRSEVDGCEGGWDLGKVRRPGMERP